MRDFCSCQGSAIGFCNGCWIDQLKAALKESLELIELYHGKQGWEEYQSSPEIKRLQAALSPSERKDDYPPYKVGHARKIV